MFTHDEPFDSSNADVFRLQPNRKLISVSSKDQNGNRKTESRNMKKNERPTIYTITEEKFMFGDERYISMQKTIIVEKKT
jgi:hypothetical protein